MTLPDHIFREYDIRGVVERDLTTELLRWVGRAYGERLHRDLASAPSDPPQVVLGRDNRPSSPELSDALATGLVEAGLHVLDLGTVPTPVVWWAEKSLDGVLGALQLTGSHNPPGWNGVKMSAQGRSLYGNDVQWIREYIARGQFSGSQGGDRMHHPVLESYIDDIRRRVGKVEPVRMVVDCGNGTGSVVAERLLQAVGVEVIPLYCESDGTFPNHHPDPTVDEYLEDLIRKVQEEGADLGVGFDGDADRIGVVDEQGRIIRGDVLLLLFGLDLLDRKGPGQLLLFDVKCSQVLPQVYEAAGGQTLMCKTGHSLMKEKMQETEAPLAGELSGHICFGGDDYLGIDDALFAACHLARIVASREEPLSAWVDRFPTYLTTPEIRLEVSDSRKVQVVDAAVEHFSARYEVEAVDGARILFPEGWALIRASNTQPVLVLRFEARSQDGLREIRQEVEGWLAGQGIHV